MNDQRTDEELNRIIAEWCGNRKNFTGDLNACHEAENKWCDQSGTEHAGNHRYRLAAELYNITVPASCQPFRATARQRAEALVRVIEKEGK